MTHIVAGNTAPGFSLKSLDNKNTRSRPLGTRPRRRRLLQSFLSCLPVHVSFSRAPLQRYGGDGALFSRSPRTTRNRQRIREGIRDHFSDSSRRRNGYVVSNAYGLTKLPTIFLIDSGGTVRSVHGFDKKGFRGYLPRILRSAKKISLARFSVPTK